MRQKNKWQHRHILIGGNFKCSFHSNLTCKRHWVRSSMTFKPILCAAKIPDLIFPFHSKYIVYFDSSNRGSNKKRNLLFVCPSKRQPVFSINNISNITGWGSKASDTLLYLGKAKQSFVCDQFEQSLHTGFWAQNLDYVCSGKNCLKRLKWQLL